MCAQQLFVKLAEGRIYSPISVEVCREKQQGGRARAYKGRRPRAEWNDAARWLVASPRRAARLVRARDVTRYADSPDYRVVLTHLTAVIYVEVLAGNRLSVLPRTRWVHLTQRTTVCIADCFIRKTGKISIEWVLLWITWEKKFFRLFEIK